MGFFSIFDYRDIIDIILVSFVIYKIIQLIRETRAMQLVKGILVLVIVAQASEWFQLNTLNYILKNTMTLGVIAIVVVFQPELRRALEQLGRGTFFEDILPSDKDELQLKMRNSIDEIAVAVEEMAKEKIGVLIIIERETKIGDIIRSGVPLDGLVSTAILRNIFIPNTPLHDGAVVVRKDRIVAAACILPLTDNQGINKRLGTRHRAALGISENSDCISVVVSEETGVISIAVEGKLIRNLDKQSLIEVLNNYVIKSKVDPKYKNYFRNKITLKRGKSE